jgi:hypothetical protein
MANFLQGLKNIFKKNGDRDLNLEDCMKKGLITEEEFLRLLKDRAIHRWGVKMLEIRNKERKK